MPLGLCFHNFEAQHVLPHKTEPIDLFLHGNLVFLALPEHKIVVYQIDDSPEDENQAEALSGDKTTLLHSMPTIKTPRRIVYSFLGDYILTYEEKIGRTKMERAVYIHANWRLAKDEIPAKVRLPGRMNKMSTQEVDIKPCFELLELPLPLGNQPVTALCVCEATGNIALAVLSHIIVYALTFLGTKKTVLDFKRTLIISTSLSAVHKLRMFREFFGIASNSRVQIFKLEIQERPESKKIRSAASVLKETAQDLAPNGRVWNMAEMRALLEVDQVTYPTTTPSTVYVDMLSSERELMLAKVLESESESKQMKFELATTHSNTFARPTPKVKRSLTEIFVSPNKRESTKPNSQFFIPPLVLKNNQANIKMAPNYEAFGPTYLPLGRDLHVSWDNRFFDGISGNPMARPKILVIYLYTRGFDSETRVNSLGIVPILGQGEHPVPSFLPLQPDLPSLNGIFAYFSTGRLGICVDIFRDIRVISQTNFTSDCLSIVCDHSFLYALTKQTLEVYTCRTLPFTHINDKVETQLYEAWKKQPICLAGKHTFVSPTVLRASNCTIMVQCGNTVEDSRGEAVFVWSTYLLFKESSCKVAGTIKDLAQTFDVYSRSPYLTLVLEGYFLLIESIKNEPESDLEEKEDLANAFAGMLGYYYAFHNESTAMLKQLFDKSKIDKQILLVNILKITQKLGNQMTRFPSSNFIQDYFSKDDIKTFVASEENLSLLSGVLMSKYPQSFSSALIGKQWLMLDYLDYEVQIQMIDKLRFQKGYSLQMEDRLARALLMKKLGKDKECIQLIGAMKMEETATSLANYSHLLITDEGTPSDLCLFLKEKLMRLVVMCFIKMITLQKLTPLAAIHTLIFGNLQIVEEGNMLTPEFVKQPILIPLLESILRNNSCHNNLKILILYAYFYHETVYLTNSTKVFETRLSSYVYCESNHDLHQENGPEWLNWIPPYSGQPPAMGNCCRALRHCNPSKCDQMPCICRSCRYYLLGFQKLIVSDTMSEFSKSELTFLRSQCHIQLNNLKIREEDVFGAIWLIDFKIDAVAAIQSIFWKFEDAITQIIDPILDRVTTLELTQLVDIALSSQVFNPTIIQSLLDKASRLLPKGEFIRLVTPSESPLIISYINQAIQIEKAHQIEGDLENISHLM